jgi:hypothetical protein
MTDILERDFGPCIILTLCFCVTAPTNNYSLSTPKKTIIINTSNQTSNQQNDTTGTSTTATILDFSDAQAKIKDDENRRRIDEGLTTGLTKEVSSQYITTCFRYCSCCVTVVV